MLEQARALNSIEEIKTVKPREEKKPQKEQSRSRSFLRKGSRPGYDAKEAIKASRERDLTPTSFDSKKGSLAPRNLNLPNVRNSQIFDQQPESGPTSHLVSQ